VNNVAVVGHSHPAVTAAASNQFRLLNTNSRFIYPLLGQYTQLLVSKMTQSISALSNHCQGCAPGGKEKEWRVFLVNSGSEATDLALRMARTVSNHRRQKLNSLSTFEQVYKAKTFNDFYLNP